MPLDPWLHDKLKTVNKILARGYHQMGKQTTPLPQNKLVWPLVPELFYDLHDSSTSSFSNMDIPSLPYWGQDCALLNASFDRISRPARMSPHPASPPILWETLRSGALPNYRRRWRNTLRLCLRPGTVTWFPQESLGLLGTCLGTLPLCDLSQIISLQQWPTWASQCW